VSAPVSTYRQFCAAESPGRRIRARVRDSAITVLSVKQSVPRSNWIRFPYYHHVFDDQRDGFTAQLRWMKNLGTPISLDDAVAMLEDDAPIDGRYFCVTFDDGYKNCITNALPILVEHEVPTAFFIPTAFVGAAAEERNPALRGRIGAYDLALTEFLTWGDCRELVAAGMTIGSHSVSHPRLIDLSYDEAEHELRTSKDTIEHRVGMECRHFACPKGRPEVDFLTHRDPAIAAGLGYRSFLTTRRASLHQRPSPMLIHRDHVIASWSVHQLRYFFSR
jgi:peptidoglycan/xylan/chitin deacetylase (PgdA/CDA1 family)